MLGRALHGSFVVENKPGAGGEIGISYAAKATPDGYTLLHAPSAITLLPSVMKSVAYDLARDFQPVTLVGLTKFCLVVSPSLPVNSVADLIALAKAKPGELTYASAGIATPHQIFAEQFKIMTGTDMRHIPYKGAVPGLTDVASGNVSVEFSDLTPALPLIQAGKLKLHRRALEPSAIRTCRISRRWPRPCRAMSGKAGRAFSPAPARRSRSSTRSTRLWSPISRSRKPPTRFNTHGHRRAMGHAGRIPRLHRRRNREMGQDHQGGGD